MDIGHNENIAGLTLKQVRNLLKALKRSPDFSLGAVAAELNASKERASEVLTALVDRGLIEARGEQKFKDESWPIWRTSLAGNRLATKLFMKRISRVKAEEIMTAFIARCQKVNDRDEFGYTVDRVRVFGSYLDKSNLDLGDIDVIIDISWRDESRDRIKYSEERALKSGKNFRSWIDMIGYAEREVLQFLKSRVPYLAFHSQGDLDATGAEARTVYERGKHPS